MKLSESHLMQLAAVLDAGSISGGAANLGLSQPSVSRALAMLEARIGEPLFVKGKRPLQATALGAQIAAHGRVILAASRRASDTVKGFMTGTKGLVRIGGVPFFMDAMISRMVAEFQNLEPDVTVSQSYGNLPDLTAALQNDLIDLAIVPLGGPEAAAGFEFTEILAGRNIVSCRTGHPLLRKPRLHISDLADCPWVAPLPGSPLMSDLHSILLAHGMSEINIRYSGGSLMSVINYMAETNALAVLPFSVVFAQRKENRITVLPLEIPQPGRALGILRRAGVPKSLAADRLAAHVIRAFEDLKHLIKRHENAVIWGR
ncbi:LysR family transcriptional regulator [Stagnihabitans tardus]|uniref:LysR family transcriptional regulator n=1 Tax=Stagnihabitans tardus TaxID=2699202 RepID=A0AAE5BUK7_9RHOB|nr:LysR family transcriptional regulator [Stagnihabitans tardus]NBZ87307.1 LysR family transcriptional regulator [Stagnihabitans tardus]